MTNTIPYLDQALRINDTLLGLPALPLLVVFGLGLGYAAKAFPFVSNKWIPTIVILGCAVGNVMLDLASVTATNVFRQVVLGFIAGCASWFVHNKWLSKYEAAQKTETPNEPPKP